jgi:hypothetical protein
MLPHRERIKMRGIVREQRASERKERGPAWGAGILTRGRQSSIGIRERERADGAAMRS